MDYVISRLIKQVNKLKSDHEAAKQDFLNRKLKSEETALLIKAEDFSATQKFTADRLRMCLEEYHTPLKFPQAYVYKKEVLISNVL